MSAPALQPFDTKNRFGTHQQFFVTGVDVDRTSLAQVTIEMQVANEGLNNFNTSFLTLSYGLGVAGEAGVTSFIETPQDSPQAICVGISRRYDRENSMGVYTYNFEGLLQDRDPFYEFELEFSMNQEPIETHPNFEVFEPIFGPYNPLNRTWPRIPTQKQSQAGGLSGPSNNAAQAVTNPLFGTTSFLSPGCVYRVMFSTVKIDPGMYNGIGTIDTPFKLDQFNDFLQLVLQSKRNWLKLAPKLRKRGGAIQVVLEWLLSGPRGWEQFIYSNEAINHSPGTGVNFTSSAPNSTGNLPKS
jgi:hypothetical protein